MSGAGEDSTHRTTSLFALACLLFVVAGPLAAWTAQQKSALPGVFQDESTAAGEEFRVTEAGRSAAVWGLPADIDRDAVRCTISDRPLDLAPEDTADVDGQTVTLLLDDEFVSLDGLSCSGGGLQEVVVSTRFAESQARTITVAALVATPVVVAVGLVLRRRGYRWPF